MMSCEAELVEQLLHRFVLEHKAWHQKDFDLQVFLQGQKKWQMYEITRREFARWSYLFYASWAGKVVLSSWAKIVKETAELHQMFWG